jgi:hypothetical protein
VGLWFRVYMEVTGYDKAKAGSLVDALHKEWECDTVTSTDSIGAKFIDKEFQRVSVRAIVDTSAPEGMEKKAEKMAKTAKMVAGDQCHVEVQFVSGTESGAVTFTFPPGDKGDDTRTY